MCRAAASSLRPRSIISGSTLPAASASTSAPRPAASPKCCSRAAPGASMRSMSAAGSCIRACAAATTSSASSRPISASSIRRVLPEQPDFATIDVSFISLKLVLPAVGNLLKPRAQILALIKPQFEAGTNRERSRKASCATKRCTPPSATTSPRFVTSLGWRVGGVVAVRDPRRRRQPRILHRGRTWLSALRSRALGHRGDGMAGGTDDPIYVPGTLPGETRRGRGLARPSRPPAAPQRRKTEPRAHRADLPAFRRLRRLRLAALGRPTPYRAWKRGLVVEALRQAGIEAPVADLIDAHGDGRRRAVFHARRGTHDVLEVGFSAARAHHVIAIDRCPILAKSLDGALAAAWAIAGAARRHAESRSISRSRRPMPASMSTCAARVR